MWTIYFQYLLKKNYIFIAHIFIFKIFFLSMYIYMRFRSGTILFPVENQNVKKINEVQKHEFYLERVIYKEEKFSIRMYRYRISWPWNFRMCMIPDLYYCHLPYRKILFILCFLWYILNSSINIFLLLCYCKSQM